MAQYNDLFGFDRLMQAQNMGMQWDRQREEDILRREGQRQQNALAQLQMQREGDTQNALRLGFDNQPYLETLRGTPELYNEAQAVNRQDMMRYNPLADAGAVEKFGGDRMETAEDRAAKASIKGSTPYFTIFNTPEGAFRHDARTGNITPVEFNGKQLVSAPSSPQLQRELAAAKAAGAQEGETQQMAASGLDSAELAADKTIQLVDELITHPGFKSSVGVQSMNPLNKVPGSPAADWMSRHEQIQGKQFLEAFKSIKGGGAITETEGKKASASLARMNTSTSPEAYSKAAEEFKRDVQDLVDLSRKKAGLPPKPRAGGTRQPQAGKIKTADDYMKAKGLK